MTAASDSCSLELSWRVLLQWNRPTVGEHCEGSNTSNPLFLAQGDPDVYRPAHVLSSKRAHNCTDWRARIWIHRWRIVVLGQEHTRSDDPQTHQLGGDQSTYCLVACQAICCLEGHQLSRTGGQQIATVAELYLFNLTSMTMIIHGPIISKLHNTMD